MAEKTNVKKRQAKATQAQIDYMVDYFIQHLHVATGKFNTLQENFDLKSSWEQLVSELNKMSKDGKTKDIKSWKSVKIVVKRLYVNCYYLQYLEVNRLKCFQTWRDNKTAVSQKVAKMRANRATTGNPSGLLLKLTERDEKILGIIGFDYVEGVQCPDSFPEEQVITLIIMLQLILIIIVFVLKQIYNIVCFSNIYFSRKQWNYYTKARKKF